MRFTSADGSPAAPRSFLPLGTLATCELGTDITIVAFAVCSAHAPHWKNAGTHGCATPSGALHWDQWFNSKNTNGYFQVHAPGPIAMTKFALTVGRGPAFEILYSDDGANWAKAAENKKSSVNSVITWPCVGKHAYWRYHITGVSDACARSSLRAMFFHGSFIAVDKKTRLGFAILFERLRQLATCTGLEGRPLVPLPQLVLCWAIHPWCAIILGFLTQSNVGWSRRISPPPPRTIIPPGHGIL